MVSKAVYNKHMIRAQDAGNWFIFRRDYVTSGLLTKVQALFLQDLLNHASAPNTQKQRDGDRIFFLCTIKYLQKSLSWEPDSQKEILKALKRKGYIEVERRGQLGQRWVTIDVEKIENDLDEALGETEDGGKTPQPTPSARRGENPPTDGGKTPQLTGGKPPVKKDVLKKTEKEHSPPAGDGETSSASLNGRFNLDKIIGNGHPPAEKLSARLFQILLKHRKLSRHYPTSPIKQWAKEFNKLLLIRSVKEIKEVLEGYDRHIREQYMPKGYGAASFCEKFVKIREALQRLGAVEADESAEEDQYAATEAKLKKTVLPDGSVRYSMNARELYN